MSPRKISRALAHPAAPYFLALAGQLLFLGGVKDDAYIEFRYAANLGLGHGLVFNVGDPPVEGSTSFAFPILLSLASRLGWSLLVVAKLIGAASVFGLVFVVRRWVLRRGGGERAAQWAAYLTAANASIAYWGQSAMEMVPAAFFCLLGVYELERRDARGLPLGLLSLAAAATLRPEGHLLFALAATLACWRALRRPDQRGPAALGLALGLALLAGMHALRWHTYGSLVPNTALVKAASFSARAGLRFLGQLGVTGLFGLVIGLALLEAARRRDEVALLAAAVLLLFALYFIRVGADEMALCRLYLPAAPLAIGLCALRLEGFRPRIASVLMLALLGAGIGFSISHAYFGGSYARGNRCEARLAAALRARGAPGDLVVDQDLGRAAYEALQLRFIDPIGLVDRPIARILYRDHANPFVRAASPAAQAQIRDRLLAVQPRFIVLIAYTAGPDHAEVERRFDAGERHGLLDEYLRQNHFHVGLFDDPRFAERYRFIDAWKRNPTYYVTLYQLRAAESDEPGRL